MQYLRISIYLGSKRFSQVNALSFVDLVLESFIYNSCLCQLVQPLFALFIVFGIS